MQVGLLVQRTRGFFEFRHALLRDTRYRRIPAAQQTALHRAAYGLYQTLLLPAEQRLARIALHAARSEQKREAAAAYLELAELAVEGAVTAEQLEQAGETFDVVLNMEVVEHVADVDLFLKTCARMVRPGGLMFVATINRTLKA